jgi:hypothetical protein
MAQHEPTLCLSRSDRCAVPSRHDGGLHFLCTDRSLSEHYPHRFRTHSRLLPAAVAAPTSTVVGALLTAFIGGSTLLNVFKEEVPSNRSSSFGWFTTGLVLYSVLAAMDTVHEG